MMLTTLLLRPTSKWGTVSLLSACRQPIPLARAISLSPSTRSQEFTKDGMPKDTETVKHFHAPIESYDKHSQEYLMPHPIW